MHPNVAIKLASWLSVEFEVAVISIVVGFLSETMTRANALKTMAVACEKALSADPSSTAAERAVQQYLWTVEGGSIEVQCGDAGLADLVTASQVIEIKAVRQWKHAIGQVLAYTSELNGSRAPRIHLFGPEQECMHLNDVVERTCASLCIIVTWQYNITNA